jgi:hypothetical protein
MNFYFNVKTEGVSTPWIAFKSKAPFDEKAQHIWHM